MSNLLTIGIAGLGLIGGSLAKAVKFYTQHRVLGYDLDAQTLSDAQRQGVIDGVVEDKDFTACDLVFVGLYPHDAVELIASEQSHFCSNAIVVDLCGVKGFVCEAMKKTAPQKNLCFIGGHPMAGREFSGFANAIPDLFQSASMILTPFDGTASEQVDTVSSLCKSIGFSRVTLTTPEKHDRVIAFTSQLAHVVSSAYVKSPSAEQYCGFSAGSFRDLTRVAKLNPAMWTELFLLNSENLADEIDEIIIHLLEYKTVLQNQDEAALARLLKDGSDRKEALNHAYAQG